MLTASIVSDVLGFLCFGSFILFGSIGVAVYFGARFLRNHDQARVAVKGATESAIVWALRRWFGF